jgi:hypothetical protein
MIITSGDDELDVAFSQSSIQRFHHFKTGEPDDVTVRIQYFSLTCNRRLPTVSVTISVAP